MGSGDEWWDVVDSTGAPTGEMHRRGEEGWSSDHLHLIVTVCVHRNDGTVLLTQRAASKTVFPLCWEFPGGNALARESSHDAARRELREETGLDVPPSALTLVDRFVEQSALIDFYIASEPTNSVLVLQQSEVAAAEWVTPEEVMRRLNAGMMADPWTRLLDSPWMPA